MSVSLALVCDFVKIAYFVFAARSSAVSSPPGWPRRFDAGVSGGLLSPGGVVMAKVRSRKAAGKRPVKFKSGGKRPSVSRGGFR